jgi:hypothetical protein
MFLAPLRFIYASSSKVSEFRFITFVMVYVFSIGRPLILKYHWYC